MERNGGNHYYPHTVRYDKGENGEQVEVKIGKHERAYYSPPAVTAEAGEVAILIGFTAGKARARGKDIPEAILMETARQAVCMAIVAWGGRPVQETELVQRCAEMACIVAEDSAAAILALPEDKRPY